MKLIVNDIDGNAVHTVDSGEEKAVRANYAADHPVQALITEAIESGTAQSTYEREGETFCTRVERLNDDE